MSISAFAVVCLKRSANATIWSTVKSSFYCKKAVASILHSAKDLQWWQGYPNEPLHIDELIPAIISLMLCNADAPLEADLCVCLLLCEESSSSAECLHFEMAEKKVGLGLMVVNRCHWTSVCHLLPCLQLE